MIWLVTDIPKEVRINDLVIRQFEIDDAVQMVEAVTESLPELLQWMPWAKLEPQTLSQREELIRRWRLDWSEKIDFPMGVFRNGILVGSTGLHLRHGVGQLEIGYWVRSSYTGTGIATQVCRALTDTALGITEIDEVLISHDVANVRSQSVPEKLGYSLVKEYKSEPKATAESGQTRLWSMAKNSWHLR